MMPRAETDRDCRLPPGVLGAPPTQAAMILLDTVIPVGPRPSTAQGEPSQRDPWAAVVLLPHKGRRDPIDPVRAPAWGQLTPVLWPSRTTAAFEAPDRHSDQ
jgi:hypothetical protein